MTQIQVTRSTETLLLILLLTGCAARRAPPTQQPTPDPTSELELLPGWPGLADAERGSPADGWLSEAQGDHPLVGIRWSLSAGRAITEAELLAAAGQRRYLMLGEKHDNADHHRLQARLVKALAQPGTVIAFEMLDELDEPQLPTSLSMRPSDPVLAADHLAEAVGWAESGWPEFALYRELFAAAIERDLTIVPALPARELLKGAMMQGMDSVDPAALEGLRLDRDYSPETLSAVQEQIQEVHCQQAPPSLVTAMVVGQRLKDAWMARALEQDSAPEAAAMDVPRPAAILIAGGGHARPDRGVASFLDRPEDAYVIALVEVPLPGEAVTPADFAGQADVLWFTPRVDNEDPCTKYAEALKTLGPVK